MILSCDWCGKPVERLACQIRGKKHIFCSRQCLADFSNKAKNPTTYQTLMDCTKMGAHFTAMNKALNPTRMIPETRLKLREARLGRGTGKGYAKVFGKAEHRVVAEKMLGRNLQRGEVVHHMDGDKRNNAPENLMVFRSQSAYVQYHAKLTWFINELEKLDAMGGDAE